VNRPALILASSSPRRRELLAAAGFVFETVSPDVRERLDVDLSARELALLNATRKGIAVARVHPGKVVLAADTLVALDGESIGKPADFLDAARILRRLSGRIHQVFSAVFVGDPTKKRATAFCDVTHVQFHRLDDSRIAKYLAKIDPLDKAGAYAAQGYGGDIISEIQGSYSNVIGLPMEETARVLHEFGIDPTRQPN
jgi:septum formation protein